MELIRLAGGETEGAVTVAVGEIVHDKVKLVGDGARGLLGAHHELVKLAGAEGALLAVILLVPAVELVQLGGILGDESVLRGELLDQGVAEEVGVLLDDLHLGALGLLALLGGGRHRGDGGGGAAGDGHARARTAGVRRQGLETDEGCGDDSCGRREG